VAAQVKSVSTILADMIRKVLLETNITDVAEGSNIGTILEAAALQDFQNQLAVLKVLESTNLQSLIGTDLDSKSQEMNIPNGIGGVGRFPARRATGTVKISSAFTKKASAIYIGKPAPFATSVKLFVQDASTWPSSGSVYVGRGTQSEEGPIPYTSIVNNSSFFTLNLGVSTPLVNNHNYSDSVILAQGGLRAVSAGLLVSAPASAGNAPVEYTVDLASQLLDGEDSISVPVTCSVFGEEGNVAGGSVKNFATVPFSGASVTNETSFASGASAEKDEALRTRIKNYVATLARGTKTAIAAALLGLRDPETGKTIISLNIVEPTNLSSPAKAYIDDGSGFEPGLIGQDFEQMLTNAAGQEVLFRTSNFPITPCTSTGSRSAPYSLSDGMFMDVALDGVVERFRINTADYTNLLSVSTSEIVRAFNSQETVSGTQDIGFRTSNGGQFLSVFDLSGSAERLQVLPSELQTILGIPTDELRPIFLYKNNELLSFKGTTGSVQTAAYPWASLTSSDLLNVGIKVDGVAQYFTVDNSDFAQFAASVTSATLNQWATVLRTKIAGLNIYSGGGKLTFASWQEFSANGSVEILSTLQNGSPSSWIGVNKLWSTADVLSKAGSQSEFELNRLSGQIKLKEKPIVGSNITVASRNTRSEIKSKTSLTGLFAVGPNSFGRARLVVAADGVFEVRAVSGSGSTSITPSIFSANSNIVRLFSSDTALFATMKLNDFLYISPDSSVANKMTARLNSFYRIRQKGLNTRSTADTFINSTLEFATPVGGLCTATLSTSGNHNCVVGQKIDIQSLVLDPATPALLTVTQAIQTVTEIVSGTQLKFVVSYAGAVPAGPNICTAFVVADSYIDIEVSDLQREAFFGLFKNSKVAYSLLSSLVNVEIPRHDILGGFINVTSASAALLAMFPGLSFGPKAVASIVNENTIQIDLGLPATGVVIPGAVTLDGQYTTIYPSYDISSGMIAAFKCEGATPQIIDLGTLPNQTADQLIDSINTAVGVSAYKISPRQIAIRSVSYDFKISTVSILATTGAASAVFTPVVSSAIQSHVANKTSQNSNSGAFKVLGTRLPTTALQYYPTAGSLSFAPTFTLIKNDFSNPDISASASIAAYPVGLQEIGISGREYNHHKRVYNNSISAPFGGSTRGTDVIRPISQSINGTNVDSSSMGLRLTDLPFSFTDKLVIQMDLDETNKTTAIPMFKRALIETMQPFGQGAGSQIEFTLKDPDDEITPGTPRPFFEVNSPFKDFDYTDFNILLKPTLIHTIYSSLPFVGNPSDALLLKSTQYGPAHELRFSINYPTKASLNTVVINHRTFEENAKTIEIISATIGSGAKVVGSDFTGIYSVTPATYTSPTGASIVSLSVSALSLNLSGVFLIGNILNIGANLPYSGAFLIIGVPNADTVIVSAPGIRSSPMPGVVVYDGSIAPLVSYPVGTKTILDIKTAIDAYFQNNPVVTATLTASTVASTIVRFPTYHTHGNATVSNDRPNMVSSNEYHSKRANFGSIAHIHTYDKVNNKIIALVQNVQPVLPLQSEAISTGYPLNYVNEECMLIPATAKALEKWMQFTAISPFFIQGSVDRSQNENAIQLSSLNLGSAGAVRVTGVSANTASSAVKSAPFKVGGSLKIRTDFATAQAFPRDTLIRVANKTAAPIYRAYRTIPALDGVSSTPTQINTTDISQWFRNSTTVGYSRPVANTGRFTFRKSDSGLIGGESIAITKVSPFIAKLEVVSGLGDFSTRVGDMLILRGAFSGADVAYTSIFNLANQCIGSASDMVNQYIGYPVVHIESPTVIYVIAPNVTAETVSARATSFAGTVTVSDNGFGFMRLNGITNANQFSVGDIVEISGSAIPSYNSRFRVTLVNSASNFINVTGVYTSASSGTLVVTRKTTEFMFVSSLKSEKNIKTNYQSGAVKAANWKISASESVFYRIKDIGNGFGFADFTFTTHDDMELDGMSVSSDDWIEFSNAFKAENRGRFRIVAHNGKNGFIFKNDAIIDEIISIDETINDGKIGSHLWRIGPKSDINVSTADKRLVRIWDGDSVFEQDRISITNPAAGVTDWFDGTAIGSWTLSKIGLDRDFDAFCEASIPNVTSIAKNVFLGNSVGSVSFTEGVPYVGYKWAIGYGHSDVSQNDAEIFVMPQVMDYKINPSYGSTLNSEFKLGFDAETSIGVDGYKYYGGLISEAHKVIDGSSSNAIAYPGVRAAGTSVEVQAPLIKSITIALQIESKDGVSVNAIKNPVRSTISTYINGLGVAKEVVLSEVTKRIQNVPGVKSVVIINTLPQAVDGVIKVGSFEVPRISRSEDILI